MKKFLYSLLTLAAALTVASCQQELEGGSVYDDGTTVDATFAVNLGPQTKAFADGKTVDKLYAGLYEDASPAVFVDQTTATFNANLEAQVTFTGKIKRGKSYKVVFWAQKDGGAYTPALNSATPTVTVATTGNANDENRDAFYGTYSFGPVTDNVTVAQGDAIRLKRPFAQINILVPDTNIDNTDATTRTSSMTVAGAPNVLNLLTGVASGSETYTFNTAAISGPAFGSFVSGYQYMAMNYVLPTQDGNGAYIVTFSVVNDSQSVTDKQVTIPLKPNVRTNIVGNIFDENFDFSGWAIIKPEAGELTTINLNVGDAGATDDNPVTLSGAGAKASVTPIISRDVTGETPTITVDPASVAKAVWNSTTKAVDITALANGTATVTVVFPAVTKTDYAEGKLTFFIKVTDVVAEKTLSSIAITTNPSKTTYVFGEAFDPTGMVVTATYSDNSTEPVTGYTTNAESVFASAGADKDVTVTYQEKTATFKVTINSATIATPVVKINDVVPTNETKVKAGDVIKITTETTGVAIKYQIGEGTQADYADTGITLAEADVAGDNVSIKFTITKDNYTTLEPTYTYVVDKGTPELTNREGFAFNSTTVSATIGETAPTYPSLSGTVSGDTPVYSSSNTSVATVNPSTGAITLKAKGTTTITASVTAHDGYAAQEVTYALSVKQWVQATSSTVFSVGDKIIIVNEGKDKALGVYADGNNCPGKAFDSTFETSIAEDVNRITLAEGNKENTFAFLDISGKYLYAAGSDKNYLKAKQTLDDNGSWVITIGTNETKILAQGDNRPLIRYNPNNGSPIFSCYANTSTTGTGCLVYHLE